MSIGETIQYIIDNKCSVARYCDGELNAVSANSLGFQSYQPQLSAKLQEYLKEKNRDANCLICLPGILAYENDYEPSTKKFWLKILVHHRREWYAYCDLSYLYGNADITRCYIELKDRSNSSTYFEMLKNIWNDRDVVIIEGEKSRLGVGTDLFSNSHSIQRVLCPPTDAFSSYDIILEYIKNNLPKDTLILLALGPTATVMAVELSQIGYQAVDIGNVDKEYEWCEAKATHKTVNPIKFTMEVENGTDVEECLDPSYVNQVVHTIRADKT